MVLHSLERNPEINRNSEELLLSNRIAVLDQGGQFVDLIQKNAERLGYPADVIPFDTPAEEIEANYAAVIISGSPANSQEEQAPMPDKRLWSKEIPILGICYGMHAMVTGQGGVVERGQVRQDGRIKTNVKNSHPLFRDTKETQTALFTHGNFVTKIPESFTVIGSHDVEYSDSDGNTQTTKVISAIEDGNHVAVQFHPEVFDDTPEGYQLFKNFFSKIANLKPSPELQEKKTEQQIESIRANIREKVGDKEVIAFVSGGVDSSVATALAATEIDNSKLHAYYIDNGFMRDEDELVIDLLEHLGVHVTKIDATEQFMNTTLNSTPASLPLKNVIDPQEKRKIIGKTFIDVQNQIVEQLGLTEAMLLQGTNAADRIESGNSKGGSETAVIKTHHNQVKEVQDLKERGLLIEPLDELFKDEIRTIGRHLGLPTEVVDRHPFPGPGLAIRVLGSRGEEKVDIKLNERVARYVDSYQKLWGTNTQSLVLPVRNVGVGGDERSHVSPVALFTEFANWDQLSNIAIDLPANFRDQINRVIIALGPNQPNDMRVTETGLGTVERAQLRHADRIVFEEMRTFGIIDSIKQCPVVLLPLNFAKQPGSRSIVLRPVITSTFMTVQAMLPGRDLPPEFVNTCSERILSEVHGISQVFLDLTNKPPGTTEWE